MGRPETHTRYLWQLLFVPYTARSPHAFHSIRPQMNSGDHCLLDCLFLIGPSQPWLFYSSCHASDQISTNGTRGEVYQEAAGKVTFPPTDAERETTFPPLELVCIAHIEGLQSSWGHEGNQRAEDGKVQTWKHTGPWYYHGVTEQASPEISYIWTSCCVSW